MGIFLTDLADVLRAAGLNVIEVDGWETRTFAAWTPGFTTMPSHIMVHHTASNTTAQNDINYILHGPISPICQIYLARNGDCHVIAAGKVATNGKGSSKPWNGGVPDNMMNHHAISIEAANNGIGEPWPREQTDAYVALCGALATAYKIPVDHIRAHWEWAPGRKIDPAGPSPWAIGKASWYMDAFRHDVNMWIDSDHPIIVEDNMQILNPPARLFDTRTSGGMLKAGEVRSFAVPYMCKAAEINFAAVQGKAPGYVTVWGDGPKPDTSALNFQTGAAIANALTVPVLNGKITVSASQDVHLIADIYAIW